MSPSQQQGLSQPAPARREGAPVLLFDLDLGEAGEVLVALRAQARQHGDAVDVINARLETRSGRDLRAVGELEDHARSDRKSVV